MPTPTTGAVFGVRAVWRLVGAANSELEAGLGLFELLHLTTSITAAGTPLVKRQTRRMILTDLPSTRRVARAPCLAQVRRARGRAGPCPSAARVTRAVLGLVDGVGITSSSRLRAFPLPRLLRVRAVRHGLLRASGSDGKRVQGGAFSKDGSLVQQWPGDPAPERQSRQPHLGRS